MSCAITPTVTSLIFVNTIIQMTRRTKYTQQSTMTTSVIGVKMAGIRHISIYPIITKSLSYIARGKVPGIFRLRSTSIIINYYIDPWVAIITNYIYNTISIIKTATILFFLLNTFIYTMRANLYSKKYTMVTWITWGRVDGLRPISTSTLNINSFSTIEIGRVASLFWPRSTFTNITTIITYTIKRERLDGLKISMSTSFITWRHFKTFFFRSFITVDFVGGRMAGIMMPISYSSITTHLENTCSIDWVGTTLFDKWMD